MQQLIEQLAAKHKVALSEPNRYLRLAMPNSSVHLIIETTDDRLVLVGCYGENGEDADPYMLFDPGYSDGWLPIELLYSPQEWETFSQESGLSMNPDDIDLADLTEYWARRLIQQGWLNYNEI